MRTIIAAGLAVTAGTASAQEQTVTFAQLQATRPALAGDVVKIVDVTVFSFTQGGGGLARDASGGAKLDDAGMPPRTIYHLERHCQGLSANPPKAQCQGTLTFKVTLREEFRGGFTVREAEFQPDKE